jgi:alkanesulfonate monooxygenase SsuD/methylene tetrahydromethanopterin reductase-like flavin-dependent oxidoreductase (luciferase family)
MMPKPLQPGGVPIWVSGRINPRVVERVRRFGLRWIPWGDDATDFMRSIPEMRARIADAGTAPDGLQVVVNLRVHTTDDDGIDVERTLAPVPDAVAAGATDFLTRFRPRASDDEFEAGLRALVDGFRAATTR